MLDDVEACCRCSILDFSIKFFAVFEDKSEASFRHVDDYDEKLDLKEEGDNDQ